MRRSMEPRRKSGGGEEVGGRSASVAPHRLGFVCPSCRMMRGRINTCTQHTCETPLDPCVSLHLGLTLNRNSQT